MSTYPAKPLKEPFAKWVWCKRDTRWDVYPDDGGPLFLMFVTRDRYDFHSFRFEPGGKESPVQDVMVRDFQYCETPWLWIDQWRAAHDLELAQREEIRRTGTLRREELAAEGNVSK